MTMHVMLVHGTAVELFDRPMYLAAFDVEVPDPVYGWGMVRLTYDVDEAMRFDSVSAVMQTWKTQSRMVPYRDDGKANRPLTRYTIEPLSIEKAREGEDPFRGIRP